VLSRAIVEAHGGQLWAEVGKHGIFVLSCPWRASVRRQQESMVTSNLTVFIVDDDPAVRDALGLLLGVRGYRTALFACGEDFLHGWRRSGPAAC
jgi:hypothetical protein